MDRFPRFSIDFGNKSSLLSVSLINPIILLLDDLGSLFNSLKILRAFLEDPIIIVLKPISPFFIFLTILLEIMYLNKNVRKKWEENKKTTDL